MISLCLVAGSVLTFPRSALAATASDNFQRANSSSLGSSWTATSDGSLAISSSQAVGQSVNGNSGDLWSAASFGSDQFAQVTLTSTQLAGSQWLGVMVRGQASNSGKSAYAGIYKWNSGSPVLQLFKRVNGTWTQLGSSFSTSALAAGTVLGLQAVGSTLSLSVNGTVDITATDATLTGGAPGIITYQAAHAAAWAGGDGTGGTSPSTYSIGGTLSGLSSGTVALKDNGGDTLQLSASGPFTFATALTSGTAYSVTVSSSPAGQSCTVANGSGTVGSANITNVAVTCVSSTYTVGGTISGLSGSATLKDNGGDPLSVTANGTFTFATPVAYGSPYNVTVAASPAGQQCTVADGSGTMGAGNVASVVVTCKALTNSVGGTAVGLSGPLTLQDNGGDTLSVTANGSFAFATQLTTGAAYGVTVATSPAGEACTVAGGAGTIATANITNVAVTCLGGVSDGFNRADGTLGTGWSDASDGGMAISGQAAAGGGSGTTGDIRTGETYDDDQFAAVQLTSVQPAGGGWIGPAVRLQSGGASGYVAFYYWNWGTPELMLFKRSNGSWSQLGSTYNSGALSSGTLALTAVGTALTLYLNGAPVITATDSSFSGGAPGIMSNGTGAVDNWIGGNTDGSAPAAATYSVGGTVTGLSGAVTLLDNGGDPVSVAANGSFSFTTQLAAGSAYNVTVSASPAGQACTVAGGTGTVGSANVTSVAVTCSSVATFTVGGTISGLSGTAVLQDNGTDNLSVTANGQFTFAGQLASGAAYSVAVASSPSGQTCTVASGSGTVGSANVTSVSVTCANSSGPGAGASASDNFQRANGSLGANWTDTSDGGLAITSGQAVGATSGNSGDMWTAGAFTSDQYSQVTLTSTQLTATQWIGPMVRAQNSGQNAYVGIYFWNNGAPLLMVFLRSNGAWSQIGGSYSVSALSAGAVLGLAATGSTITMTLNGAPVITTTSTTLTGGAPGLMTNGAGRAAAWSGGSGAPAPTYSVGGTISGLSGTVGLQDNGGDTLLVSANGSFTFASQLTQGAGYNVTVATNPSGQNCTVAGGTGTVGSGNVTSVTVTCAALPTYSVGGTVSGLSGTVVLQDNFGDNLGVSANGPFTFATKLGTGNGYNVTVGSSPAGQVCNVSNGMGTIGAANVTNVSVTCAAVATYTIGGTVSGLSGTVSLQDNGGDTLLVQVNGPFTFATSLPSGASYAVAVAANPAGQSCTVSGGSGTVGSGNVTSVAVACAATSGASASDNFQRANGGLGPNWTATSDGGLTIAGNVAVGAASGNSGDMWTAGSFTSDQYSQVTLTSTQLGATQWVGPMVRGQNSGQNAYVGIYFWNNGAPELMLFLRDNGGWQQLGSAYSVSPLPVGTVIALSAAGGTLSLTLNGTQVVTAADATLSGGAPGLMTNGAAQAAAWAGGSGTPGGSGSGPTYSVGGTVSGLTGTMSLTDNGTDTLQVAANGSITFPTKLATGAAYSVTVAVQPSGETCAVANGSGTVGSANVTGVTVTCQSTVGQGQLTVTYSSTDSTGVATYTMTSPIVSGGASEPLRVLKPTSPAAGVAHNFLLVLPVEPGEGTTYGDGISTLQSLDAQDQYNLTIIEPSFSLDPWYADSATDSGEQQETFLTSQLVPWIKANLATTGTEQVWLLGFSKSGLGAEDLILKHPSVYSLAGAWDFPADMTSYSQLGTSPQTAYGTNANYVQNYQLTQSFINAHAAPFTAHDRLWIGSYYYFDWDVNDYDGRLTTAGIPHDTEPPTQMAHRWDSGWVPAALAALHADSTHLSG